MERVQRELLTRKILTVLPTSSDNAIRKNELALQLDITLATASRELKRIRLSGVPILWCRKGLFIDYEPNAILKQNEVITNMKIGYDIGMTNIQNAYGRVLNGEHEDKREEIISLHQL